VRTDDLLSPDNLASLLTIVYAKGYFGLHDHIGSVHW